LDLCVYDMKQSVPRWTCRSHHGIEDAIDRRSRVAAHRSEDRVRSRGGTFRNAEYLAVAKLQADALITIALLLCRVF
jgi:hypothetical protein